MGAGKPRGLRAARKLKSRRRTQRWADKQYKKSHQGNEYKQPTSAVRKCVRVKLKKNNKRITAYGPRDGGMSFIDENDEVVIAGFGRKGHAKGDIPGVRFQVIKVKGVSLWALFLHKKEKPR